MNITDQNNNITRKTSSWDMFKDSISYGFRESYTPGRFLPWFITAIVFMALSTLAILCVISIPAFADFNLGWTWLLMTIMGIILTLVLAGFNTLFNIFGLNTVKGRPVKPYEDIKLNNFYHGVLAYIINNFLITVPTFIITFLVTMIITMGSALLSGGDAYITSLALTFFTPLIMLSVIPAVILLSVFLQFTVIAVADRDNDNHSFLDTYKNAVIAIKNIFFPTLLVVISYTLMSVVLSFTIIGPYLLIVPIYSSLAYLYYKEQGKEIASTSSTQYNDSVDNNNNSLGNVGNNSYYPSAPVSNNTIQEETNSDVVKDSEDNGVVYEDNVISENGYHHADSPIEEEMRKHPGYNSYASSWDNDDTDSMNRNNPYSHSYTHDANNIVDDNVVERENSIEEPETEQFSKVEDEKGVVDDDNR